MHSANFLIWSEAISAAFNLFNSHTWLEGKRRKSWNWKGKSRSARTPAHLIWDLKELRRQKKTLILLFRKPFPCLCGALWTIFSPSHELPFLIWLWCMLRKLFGDGFLLHLIRDYNVNKLRLFGPFCEAYQNIMKASCCVEIYFFRENFFRG